MGDILEGETLPLTGEGCARLRAGVEKVARDARGAAERPLAGEVLLKGELS